jgi:hypothetical protein
MATFFDITLSSSVDEQVGLEHRKTFIHYAVLMMNYDKSLPLVESIKLDTFILLK